MAAATAVAVHKVNRPVRVVLDMRSNMEMFGKRLPYLGEYKVCIGLCYVIKIFYKNTNCDVIFSVTRFGEILPHWHNFEEF